MNKVKMFFIAAALVLTTAGVFATKVTTFQLFAQRGSQYYQLDQTAQSALGTGITTGAGTAITLTGNSGFVYNLVYNDGAGNYNSVSSTTW